MLKGRTAVFSHLDCGGILTSNCLVTVPTLYAISLEREREEENRAERSGTQIQLSQKAIILSLRNSID